MFRANIKRLTKPSVVGALLAVATAAVTSACGNNNNNNNDDNPRITSISSSVGGFTQQVASAAGCAQLGNTVTVTIQDPSNGNGLITESVTLTQQAQWNQGGTPLNNRGYLVQSMYNPNTCQLLTLTSWGPLGTTVPSSVRLQRFSLPATGLATLIGSGPSTANYTDLTQPAAQQAAGPF